MPQYKRILLKLSGEVLAGGQKLGLDFDTVNSICSAIKEVVQLGVQVAVVVGGGNFFRGRTGGPAAFLTPCRAPSAGPVRGNSDSSGRR